MLVRGLYFIYISEARVQGTLPGGTVEEMEVHLMEEVEEELQI